MLRNIYALHLALSCNKHVPCISVVEPVTSFYFSSFRATQNTNTRGLPWKRNKSKFDKKGLIIVYEAVEADYYYYTYINIRYFSKQGTRE